jgi:PAS domain S-box-containing protein
VSKACRIAGWLLLVLSCTSLEAAAQSRTIVILHSFEREFEPLDAVAAEFRKNLAEALPSPINFVEISLRPTRWEMSPPEEPILSYVDAAVADAPDLIVTMGGPAAQFARRHRARLFPSTPLLIAAVDRRLLAATDAASENETVVATSNDPALLIQNALNLLPDTQSVLVVLGASEYEQVWRVQFERELHRFDDRLTFLWTDGMPYDEVVAQTASLPPNSVVFYVLMSLDTNGVPYTQRAALSALRRAANVPIIGWHSTQLGQGVLGGPVTNVSDLSRTTVGVALQLLNGQPAGSIKTPLQQPGASVFDWRELRRWNIPERRLPAGSTVLFRESSIWERYRWQIVAGLAVFAGQAILVGALIAGRLKRRRAEQLLRESEQRFRLMSNAAPVMVWVSAPDMLRIDVNTAWLDFTGRTTGAELGSGWMDGVHPDDRTRCIDALEAAREARGRFRIEYRLRRHDGSHRWILDTGVPRFAADGVLVGFIGSALDITELKVAQSALAALSRRVIEEHERERTSIARELHEDVSQRLIGLTMQLHALSLPRDIRDDETRHLVARLCDQFAALGTDVRAISYRLHSARLEHFGLVAAARALCEELEERREIDIEFHDTGVPDDLPKATARGLFRVLQEALENAIVHSGARHVAVTIRATRTVLCLEVVDVGAGFDEDEVMRTGGLGLVSMRERINLLGGELSIVSAPAAGTTIRARIPLSSRAVAVRTSVAEADIDRV